MEINRHNYEAYLLDLMEGGLSVEDQLKLNDFLRLNPDCNVELSEMEPWVLEPAKMSYPDRSILKKEFPEATSILTSDNFDLFSIARMEGDLSREQEEAHRRMTSEDVQKYQQWSVWQLTKVVPEPFAFRKKESLKRRRGLNRSVIWISLISAAAAIAMLVVLLRMEPVSSTRDFSQQSISDTPEKKLHDATAGPDNQTKRDEPLEEHAIPETSVLLLQKSVNPGEIYIVKDQDSSTGTALNQVVVTKDDLQPRPVRVHDNRPYISSLAGNPIPDKIKSLEIPPVSIHLSSLSLAQISELDLQAVVKDYREEKDLTFWTIANAGIKGINRIAGSDISLMASRDEEGDVSGFQLKSKRFSVTRPLGQ
jgi:hypothetical protein